MDLLIIFTATFLVRIFSVMVGGGRATLMPLLILIGLPSTVAFATLKVSGISNLVSLFNLHKHGQVKWKIGTYLIPFVTVGTILGNLVVININQEIFKIIISVSISISLILFLFRGIIKIRKIEIKNNYLVFLLGVISGFIGGCFGFRGLLLRYLYMGNGLSFIEATATKRVTGILGDITSLITFSFAGIINWPLAAVMFIGGGIGAWVGASLGIKVGNKWLERIFAFVIFISVIKMFL